MADINLRHIQPCVHKELRTYLFHHELFKKIEAYLSALKSEKNPKKKIVKSFLIKKMQKKMQFDMIEPVPVDYKINIPPSPF